MVNARHPGSRLVPHDPDLVRALKAMRRDIQRAATAQQTETIVAIPAVPSRWEPATAAAMANVQQMNIYRSGSHLFCDVACGTGAGSVLRVQLTCPDLALTGTAVTTASGGTQRIIRVQLDFPDAWTVGAVHLVYAQAMRVSGSDSTTMAVIRAWQR
ncbi:hypothetical protein [Actinomadura violacea]|uniref:Uncharacterized protein n=1 Tax=Actinomadura violacea TaxID=2819934 RepID=A0ABS3RYE0_9ACTN|nr:hypothetical protein [Actinomadura violacea]MBO2461661.1 hypothetical protein [Actinomadura violacea]